MNVIHGQFQHYHLRFAVPLILGLNLIVFFLFQFFPYFAATLVMNPLAVLSGCWWQPLTYLYVHANVSHLLANMVGLLLFGVALENEMKSWEFLLYYHLTGVLAGLFSFVIYLLTSQMMIILLGCSASIFAILLAYAVYRPRVYIIFGEIRTITLVIFMTTFILLSQIFLPYSGLAHLTHLAGFFFGFLYLWVRMKENPWKRLWAR